MKDQDRCTARDGTKKQCILENQHHGPHENVTAMKWGQDRPQCPVSLPSGTRCLRLFGHSLPHKMHTGVDFIEYTDEDIARVTSSIYDSGNYNEAYQQISETAAVVPLPPQSLARRLFNILDCADDRPFVPISQELLKEIIVALPKEYI